MKGESVCVRVRKGNVICPYSYSIHVYLVNIS